MYLGVSDTSPLLRDITRNLIIRRTEGPFLIDPTGRKDSKLSKQ